MTHYKYSTWLLKKCSCLQRSHNKWKDSLETRAEQTVLRAYVENQAIAGTILLYRVLQNINKRNQRAIKTVSELPFHLPTWLTSGFFISSVKIQTCQDQKFSNKCCNSSKKQISNISNTKWRAKLVGYSIPFQYFLHGASYKIRAFKYYRAD